MREEKKEPAVFSNKASSNGRKEEGEFDGE
jgi:hypothetical protein